MNTETDPDAIAVVLRAALAKLGRRLRPHDDPGGVGATGLSLLARLWREGPSTASRLASEERLQPQSLTRVLQAMEARDLIVRAGDASDRRRTTIAITENGIRLLRQTVRNRESWLAQAMKSTLSQTERDMLRLAVALLERLADTQDTQ
ncbi:MAG TPA: MarR family transcriptional regulator [Candidatus Baltobacteraceae bacterium]|nr:MarR family transcriptional regulator [Candidatus Baltobacteraceae bacterium]